MLDLKIIPIRLNSTEVVVRVEIHNPTNEDIEKAQCLLAVRDVNVPKNAHPISCIKDEWIDFKSDDFILHTTKKVSPGETIVVERLYYIPAVFRAQVGFQFKSTDGRQWTTTRFIY